MKRIILGDYIDVLTDYHSGGSYKTLKEHTKILHEPNYAVMVRTINFENDNFQSDLIYCDEDSYNFLEYCHVFENDIFMNKIANAGSVYIMPKVPYKATCAMNLFLLRFKNINQRYIFYVMKNSESYIKSQAHGTTTKTITKDEVRNLSFLIHDTEGEQNVVESILTSIDAKIALNKSICSDLEAMAKLIYDYWFVQFDFPDENGKPYKSSGGKMIYNEELKREIPEGWEVKPLGEIISSNKNGDWGYEVRKNIDDIEVTCFRGTDFTSITNDYQIKAPKRYISSKNSDRLLTDGDLLIEISGGSPTQATGRIGYVNQKFLDRNGGKIGCSNFCKVFTPIKNYYQFWLYQTWKLLYDAGFMFKYENKTTGIKNFMFNEFVTDICIPVPIEALLIKYHNYSSQYYNKIQECFIENRDLVSLRDFLLPMLMNGQVKVGNPSA